jgi:hypothetical protein
MARISKNSETVVSAIHAALNMSFILKVGVLHAKRKTKFLKPYFRFLMWLFF